MVPGIPGGTQFAMGESLGASWKALRMAAYFGVRTGCCGGPNPPPRPKLISQTPLMSGSFWMDSNEPPGNLLASAADIGVMDAIRARPHTATACFVAQPV